MAPTSGGMMAAHTLPKGHKAHPAKTAMTPMHSATGMMPANSMAGTH
jgi:hypothetical protein